MVATSADAALHAGAAPAAAAAAPADVGTAEADAATAAAEALLQRPEAEAAAEETTEGRGSPALLAAAGAGVEAASKPQTCRAKSETESAEEGSSVKLLWKENARCMMTQWSAGTRQVAHFRMTSCRRMPPFKWGSHSIYRGACLPASMSALGL
mmetsp:Transcript_3950/g.9298  ORF Transcript_3950/g.9298 Transcript_3950/m.9298 type:complete len:154 (+) Transcript_3950:2125-2586(+)